jgi:hypothetical protein
MGFVISLVSGFPEKTFVRVRRHPANTHAQPRFNQLWKRNDPTQQKFYQFDNHHKSTYHMDDVSAGRSLHSKPK